MNTLRPSLVALSLVGSLGGGAAVASASGVGPLAAHATVHDATWYGDNAVRAWGAGDRATAERYLTGGTARALFGWKSRGGSDWSRTGSSVSGGVSHVTYRNGAGSTLTLTVNNGARTKGTRVISYASWTIGRGAGAARTTAPRGAGSGWVATTRGFGAVRIGGSMKSYTRQGLVSNLRVCDGIGSAYTRGGTMVRSENGRVVEITLGAGARTRAGGYAGMSESALQRLYGNQVRRSETPNGHIWTLDWNDGNSITFLTDQGKVRQIIIAKGHPVLDGGGPGC